MAGVSARHELYTQNVQLWQYFADHYAGGPLYGQKPNPLFRPQLGYVANAQQQGFNRYITQHGLEDTTAYLNRLYKAPCVNLCAPAVDMMAGTVGSPESVIMTDVDDFEPLIKDADLSGSSFFQFMLDARTQAAVHGHVFIIADSTRAAGEIKTQADVIAQGIRPYFRTILPTDMLTWRLDAFGRPIEILFRVKIEAPGSILEGAGSKDRVYEYRYWSLEGWIVYRTVGENLTVYDSGPNQLHEIPVTPLYHKKTGLWTSDSLLKESSRYSQLLSNWISDLDQTMTMQSFSQACVRSKDTPSQVGIGNDKILHLAPESKNGDSSTGAEDFFYRSPDSAPLKTMWDSFFQVLDLANASMDLSPEATADKSHPESGISRAWRWHSTEKRLTAMVTNEQTCVASLFNFAAKWMGQDAFEGSITYGTHFDLSSLESDIDAMLQLQKLAIPPTAQKELKSRVIKKALPNHCCPRQDRPVAGPAENTRLGGTPVGYLGGGLRFEISRPVQVIPKPG